MTMIRSALKAGIRASYILMDTWFTNEPFINNILGEGLDVIGMLKDNKQLYRYQGKLYNLKALSKLVAFNKAGNIFGSITVTTKQFNIPVKLVFVRNRNKTGEYIILLEWLRRKVNDPKTICELFYVYCDAIQDIELCTALSSLAAIFMEGIRTEAIKITNAVKTQLINWFVSQPAFIKALFPEPVWEV